MVVTVMSFTPNPVLAQNVDARLFIPDTAGESTASGHTGWIDVETLGINVIPTKRATQCEISLVKKLDRASPDLWAATAAETTFPEMTIEMIVSTNG